MKSRNRNTFGLLLAVLVALSIPYSAFAGINDSWDWKDGKRKLKVFYNFKDTDKLGDKTMKEVMDEAIDNWNGVKADTGWEFVKGGTKDDHDIEVKQGKVTSVGGAVTSFDSIDKDRRVSKRTITFDPAPAAGYKWGIDDDKKKNPVSAAKHELSHTLRLTHQGGTRSETKKIKDPQGAGTKGDDVLTISDDDKKEAKTSSTAPIKKAQAPAAPGVGASLSVPGFPRELPVPVISPNTDLVIPSNSALNDVLVTLSWSDMYSMPDPFRVPLGIDRMVKGVQLNVTGTSAIPMLVPTSFLSLDIPYEDGLEGEGFLIDLADPEYSPRIIESSLQPFLYNPLSRNWSHIDPLALGGTYFLDTVNDVVHFTLPSNLLYQFPVSDDLRTGTLFLAISGAPVPEPGTWILVASALLGMIGLTGKSQKSR